LINQIIKRGIVNFVVVRAFALVLACGFSFYSVYQLDFLQLYSSTLFTQEFIGNQLVGNGLITMPELLVDLWAGQVNFNLF
jgi:hypothetical protein